MKYLIVFFSIVLLCNCSKQSMREDVGPVVDPIGEDSLVIWKVALCSADSNEYLSNKPYLTEDGGVIFTQDFCDPNTSLNGHRVFCYDKNSGVLRWSQDISDEHYLISRTGLIGDYFWSWHRGRFHVIDTRNGFVVRDQYFQKSTASIGSIGSNVYFVQESDKNVNHLRGDYSHLCRTSIVGKSIDTIYSLKFDEEGYRPFPTAPSLFIESNGDSSLIYANRAIRYSKLKYTLLKIDLEQRELKWVSEKIADQGHFRSPMLNDGKVFINGVWSVHCVDVITGKELWQRKDIQGGSIGESLVMDNVYIVNDGNKSLFGLNKENGQTLWENKIAGAAGTYSIMEEHDGFAFMNIADVFEPKLNKVNPSTGEIVWKYESPHNGRISGSFNSGFAIDKNTNIIYASDKRYSMAIKIPQ